MMIDTSPWSSCSRRSPWLPCSSHKISSTGQSVSPFRDFLSQKQFMYRKFLRVEICHPESSHFLGLCMKSCLFVFEGFPELIGMKQCRKQDDIILYLRAQSNLLVRQENPSVIINPISYFPQVMLCLYRDSFQFMFSILLFMTLRHDIH